MHQKNAIIKILQFKCKNCGEIHYINQDDTTEILTGITMEKVGAVAY